MGVESGAAAVGDGEGHGLMPRARSRHHVLDVFGGSSCGWIIEVEVVVDFAKNGGATSRGIVQRVHKESG